MFSIKSILKYSFPMLFVLLLAFALVPEDATVIQVGNHKIAFREFEQRLNDVSLPNESYYTEQAVKEDLASTLIAETILASEAKKENLDTLPQVQAMSNEYYKEALYEQWMEKQVTDKIQVTPTEIQVGYDRLKDLKWVNYWILPSEDKALALRQKLLAGSECKEGRELKKLEYGEALENIENTVYGMRVGQVSDPIKVDNQYYIFQLLKTEQDPRYAKHDPGFYRKTIIDRIKSKKSTSLVAGLLKNLMEDKGYDVELGAYKYLLNQLDPVVFSKEVPSVDRALAVQQKLLEMDLKPDKINDQPLVVFKNGKVWTVRDVWEKLKVSPYPLNYADPDSLKYGVLQVINQTVILNSVANDAIAKGYSGSPYVQDQTQMWTNNLLAQALLNKFRESLTIKENDVRAFYDSTKDRHLQSEVRKIIPLVVNDKQLAEKLYHEIRQGANIITLARRYGVNKLGVENSKDPGVFVAKEEWGNIGTVAFKLKVGEVSPIQKIEDSSKISYAIVKLIKVVSPRPYPYDQIHQRLYAAYQDMMLHRYVNDFLLKAVKDYRVEVNQSLLASVLYAGGDLLVLKNHFPLRTGAPGVQFFCPQTDFTHPSDWNGMNSPLLADWYNYAQSTWFKD